MAHIVMADDGIPFDGRTAETGPLGGAETAFVALAEALSARGHQVEARSRCREALVHNGVSWAPIETGAGEVCDLYIGNRGYRVIGYLPRAGRRLFWLHNPARYLKKPRNLLRLAWWRPTLVATGPYHLSTVPGCLPCGGRIVIPYGVSDFFRKAVPREPPPPRAIFTSNPLRGLDWLLDLWTRRIAPAVPGAELHIYAGPAVYGPGRGRKAGSMEAVLARAEGLAAAGVRRHAPVGHRALAAALAGVRAMLYRGDPGETFCLALAEAQAMGVPAVVTRSGAVAERVIDGVTGCVAVDEDAFVEAAVALLSDDALWRRRHLAALERQRGLAWDEVAARFEATL
ncbi:MAG TPA: glycosyltransferase family 4 protein [Stellaceae bacterium]|nr:glycosyltransferase family 4 protein [Stellaceae bacterium]